LVGAPFAKAEIVAGVAGEAGRGARGPEPFPRAFPTIRPTPFPTVTPITGPTSFPTIAPTAVPTVGPSGSQSSGSGQTNAVSDANAEPDDGGTAAATAVAIAEDFRREGILDGVPLVRKHREIGTSD
jgi:hypothetical protein